MTTPPNCDGSHARILNLARGHPNNNLLPLSELHTALSSLTANEEEGSWITSLNYGADAGEERLRTALHSFLERRCAADDGGDRDDRDRGGRDEELFVTGGVSHALDLLCATHCEAGDEVWVERPTYYLAREIFASHRLTMRPLPMKSDHRDDDDDDDGDGIGRIDVDRLVRIVEEGRLTPPKMIYVVPSYQNPTGRSASTAERAKLAAFAERNGVLLVADEVYHLLDWECNDDGQGSDTSRRPARMVRFNSGDREAELEGDSCDNAATSSSLTTKGCCVSVSSFTKIFAPGIRLGWIEGPARVIRRVVDHGYIQSQGGVGPFVGRIMTSALESGAVDSYLDRLRDEYRGRRRTVLEILGEEPRISVLGGEDDNCSKADDDERHGLRAGKRAGGYFVWIRFPPEVDSLEFLQFSLEKHGVKFMPGPSCDPFFSGEKGSDNLGEGNTNSIPAGGDATADAMRSSARLCFADLNRDDLEEGTRRLVLSFREYMATFEQ